MTLAGLGREYHLTREAIRYALWKAERRTRVNIPREVDKIREMCKAIACRPYKPKGIENAPEQYWGA